jgi:intraflagellar transport protein 56
MSNSVED